MLPPPASGLLNGFAGPAPDRLAPRVRNVPQYRRRTLVVASFFGIICAIWHAITSNSCFAYTQHARDIAVAVR
jgi:hypothetical protein